MTPWTVAQQATLSTEFSRQEYWSGLPLPSPGDLPDPGVEPVCLALAGRFFTTEPPRTSPTGAQRGDILQIHPLATGFLYFLFPNPSNPPSPRSSPVSLYFLSLYKKPEVSQLDLQDHHLYWTNKRLSLKSTTLRNWKLFMFSVSPWVISSESRERSRETRLRHATAKEIKNHVQIRAHSKGDRNLKTILSQLMSLLCFLWSREPLQVWSHWVKAGGGQMAWRQPLHAQHCRQTLPASPFMHLLLHLEFLAHL